MGLKDHFELLATYNQWMNARVYEAAGRLDSSDRCKERGAFFGSIHGTLNHILVADTIWLKRFAQVPSCKRTLRDVLALPDPSSLAQILFEEFDELSEQRAWLDAQICQWVGELSETDLEKPLSYRSMKGVSACKIFSSLILHFFNHQTHHRGQASVLLSQAGEDVGVTDLLVQIPGMSYA